ncbi:hypothetical protein [Microbacterium natoriense]
MSDVLAELAEAGFPVSSVDELRRSGVKYARAVPILIRELAREKDPNRKEWVIRALSVPWAKPLAIQPLISEFRTLPLDESAGMDYTRWSIGNALEILWDDNYFDELANLALERKYGRSREMIVLGFGKSKLVERATAILLSLCGDPAVEGHAISALASWLTLPRRMSCKAPP